MKVLKPASADKKGESTKTWPRVPRIEGDEFQQSVAVAQLAVQLCEMEKVALGALMLDPDKYLGKAWELIKKAREHVLRPQTDIEYLIEQGSPREALAEVIGRHDRERMIPFASLCDPNRNKGDPDRGCDVSRYRQAQADPVGRRVRRMDKR
jgi:hypothetical protein